MYGFVISKWSVNRLQALQCGFRSFFDSLKEARLLSIPCGTGGSKSSDKCPLHSLVRLVTKL